MWTVHSVLNSVFAKVTGISDYVPKRRERERERDRQTDRQTDREAAAKCMTDTAALVFGISHAKQTES